jgi:hypothetical protein
MKRGVLATLLAVAVLTGCIRTPEPSDLLSGAREQLSSAKATTMTTAAGGGRQPNSSISTPDYSLPSYLSLRGTEPGSNGPVEVWAMGSTVYDVEQHWATLKTDLAKLYPVGRPMHDWAWCSNSTDTTFMWLAPKSNGAGLLVVDMSKQWQDIFVEIWIANRTSCS